MADLARIKRNVAKMAAQNAPVEDIDGYIRSEGVTLDDVRNFKPAKVDPATNQPPGVPAFSPPGVKGYDPQSGEVTPQSGIADTGAAYAFGALNGVPLAGPALMGATKGAAAGIASLTSGEPYSQVYEDMDRAASRVQSDHPIATTAGNVTGAVAGMLPIMRAAPAAFGLGGGSTGTRLAASTLGGGALGAADTGIRTGGDLGEMKRAAQWGGALGFAGPIVGPLVGKGVKAAADKVKFNRVAKALGIDKQAAQFIKKAAEADGLDPQAARNALDQLGPDGMLLDLGPNMKGLSSGLASMPGEGNQIVRSAIEARDSAANWRIRSALDETLGPSPVPSKVLDRIQRSQQALQPRYREAFRNAQPVKTGMIARYLDKEAENLRGEAQRAVQKIRSMLNKVGTDRLETSPGVLLQTRQAVDDMLETVQSSNARNAIQTARQAIDDALSQATPLVKEADAGYAELARQKEALQRGQTVLASGREAPRPIELAEEFKRGALPQGKQIGPSAVPLRLRQGARAEIERIVGNRANDRVALQQVIKGEGDWNRARLSTLFGKDKANAIIDVLDRERAFADTSNLITRNSETAARNAQQRALMGANDPGLGTVDGFVAGGIGGAARGAAVKGVDKVVEALRNVKNDQVRAQIATTLTGQRSPVLDALLTSGANVPVSKIDRIARALLLSSPQSR